MGNLNDAAAREVFASGGLKLGLHFSSLQLDQFMTYLSELMRWNQKINLTGLRETREIIIKNFLDSLTPLPFLGEQNDPHWMDVGTGAGFPGLPMKIAGGGINLSLVEPIQKKTAFLHHMIGILGLKEVRVINDRIENVVQDKKADLLFTRALSPKTVLSKSVSLVRGGGRLLFYQSRYEEAFWNLLVSESPFVRLEKIIPVRLPFSEDPRVLIFLRML